MLRSQILQGLFGLILYIPVNNFSVMLGQVFLGLTSTKHCSRTQHTASIEAPTANPGTRVKHSTTEPMSFILKSIFNLIFPISFHFWLPGNLYLNSLSFFFIWVPVSICWQLTQTNLHTSVKHIATRTLHGVRKMLFEKLNRLSTPIYKCYRLDVNFVRRGWSLIWFPQDTIISYI